MAKAGDQFRSVHVGFMVDEVAPGRFYFEYLNFLLVSFTLCSISMFNYSSTNVRDS